jgi:hypothetical protein
LGLENVFGVKSRVSKAMNNSNKGSRVSRITSIKHKKNAVFLGKREGFYDNTDGNENVCELF